MFRFVVLVLVWGLTWVGQGVAQQTAQPQAPEGQIQAPAVGEQPSAMMFRHPKQGYLIAIPPGAIVEHRDEVSGIAMKSRKGYMITVQTSDAKTGTPLPDLMSRLEQRYLGNGRPWTHKLGGQPTKLAGLPAFEALYEGAGSRVRVIITRDSKFDYAFIFIAPPQEFNRLISDFNWVLQSFRPAHGGMDGNVSAESGDGLVEMMAGKVQHLKDSGLGFTIDYPFSWRVEQGSGPYVIISGQKGSPAFFATITVQNVEPPSGVANITQATQRVVADLKRQLKQADASVRFPGQGAYGYAKGGLTLNGLQFTVEYEHLGQQYKQWSVVLARPDNGIVHVWSYAAPEDRYQRYGAIAGHVLQSWQIIPGN
ncbi:MAG: hypothetical protein HOL66_16610 [Rhodospirillaceae bacterium]|jgi:hypothetical protein|nr:hypothetical protein [Rhodospirillaceae bacterium]MBT5245855.1 hypothetical protein [Rhodospirillaceae bacterium]MBT5561253.1 hypothetical protein [Rhodospirillaceae bacterium]MBT6240500.1 hypothetical protein [Rhodospirillaceae bacterium]MBT7136340.1 hypothetical protein [Rhodospirillaceae bacterium]